MEQSSSYFDKQVVENGIFKWSDLVGKTLRIVSNKSEEGVEMVYGVDQDGVLYILDMKEGAHETRYQDMYILCTRPTFEYSFAGFHSNLSSI